MTWKATEYKLYLKLRWKKGKKHCVAYSELKKNFFGEAIIILTALTMT